jgi:hypothetical protein
MSIGSALDYLPIWSLFWIFVGTLLLMIEVGYRVGRYRRQQNLQEMETAVGTIVGATLGMLGFILAFTFGLAAERFDARRQIVVEEANAIGTTYLRAGLLPDDSSIEKVRKLLDEYVDLRIKTVETGNVELSLKPVERVQDQLWEIAETVGRNNPNSVAVASFTESLNEMIDIHSRRILVALRNRLPVSLWTTLFWVTCFTMIGVGYHEGLCKSKRSPSSLVMIFSFCIVLKLIADLDRPQDGELRVSQEAIERLQEMIHGNS